MRLIIFAVIIVGWACQSTPTAHEVIDRSIAFHDPEDNWDTFQGTFHITMREAKGANRYSMVAINQKTGAFRLDEILMADTVTRYVGQDTCYALYNGSSKISEEVKQKRRVTCEAAKMYRNYYTYLYGLPMKLKDAGTIIKGMKEVTVHDQPYYQVKVMYEESVGSDIWYFYFNKETFAMEAYQFFHDEALNDGEYILLNALVGAEGIQFPKERAWYYNKDSTYLATDLLDSIVY